MSYSKGEWKERLVMGEREIYIDSGGILLNHRWWYNPLRLSKRGKQCQKLLNGLSKHYYPLGLKESPNIINYGLILNQKHYQWGHLFMRYLLTLYYLALSYLFCFLEFGLYWSRRIRLPSSYLHWQVTSC